MKSSLASLRADPLMQLDKSRPASQEMVVVQLKRTQQDLRLIFTGELRGRTECSRKPRFVELPAGVFLKLRPQRRHDIEGRMNARKFLKHTDHAPIVLERMKTGPRQHIASGRRIAILRLVH